MQTILKGGKPLIKFAPLEVVGGRFYALRTPYQYGTQQTGTMPDLEPGDEAVLGYIDDEVIGTMTRSNLEKCLEVSQNE